MGLLDRLCRIFRSDEDADAPERLPSPDALVLLTRVSGEPEALMLQELLRNEGIHALARNASLLASPHIVGGLSTGWELLVLRRDLRRATELLAVST